MRLLVVYYSRTGMTRKVARTISSSLLCDIEDIIDLKNKEKDASQRKLTEIAKMKKDPALYEVVFIGTPAFRNAISSAIRTYIHNNKERLKKVAFFCAGGSESIVFREIESLCGKKPITTLGLKKEDMRKRRYITKAEEFATDVPAIMVSDLWERTEKARCGASLTNILKLQHEFEDIRTC